MKNYNIKTNTKTKVQHLLDSKLKNLTKHIISLILNSKEDIIILNKKKDAVTKSFFLKDKFFFVLKKMDKENLEFYNKKELPNYFYKYKDKFYFEFYDWKNKNKRTFQNISNQKIQNLKKGKYYLKKKSSNKLKLNKSIFQILSNISLKKQRLIKRIKLKKKNLISLSIKQYKNISWFKDLKYIKNLLKFRKSIQFLESQGLKRKNQKKRLNFFSRELFDKQKLKFFYFNLKEKTISKMIHFILKKKSYNLNLFVYFLEARIISFLYRINLTNSFINLKKIIRLGLIKVNNIKIFSYNYLLKPGDIISIDKKIFDKKLIEKRYSLFFYPCSYIELSFSIFQFIFFKIPENKDVYYPFNLNFNRILLHFINRGF